MKLIFSSNVSWSIYNFRFDLLKSLQNEGFEIYTVAANDKYSKKLKDAGFHFKAIHINNNGTNPFKDVLLIVKYLRIYKCISPDIICHNAIKPNIYGTIAAGILGIPVVNNISGLGTLFIKKSLVTRLVIVLYRFSQKFASIVLFQNKYDRDLFISKDIISKDKTQIINGSGVNTAKFVNTNFRNGNRPFTFLFVGRLLKDKGIFEFIEAVRLLKILFPDTQFNILGPLYKSNQTAITLDDINRWNNDEKIITYLGESDDVKSELAKADCLVLPSYREGLSKVLIEASSMSLPIITTDVPGCKDVVLDGVTGFLCSPRDSKDLASKMEKMLNLEIFERLEMGRNARDRALDIFDVKHIIKTYKKVINLSLNNSI